MELALLRPVPDFLCNDPFSHPGAWLNLPALLITLLVTAILVIGIRESATTNAVLVAVKIGVVLFVICVGAFYVNPANWTSLPPSNRVFTEDLTTIPELAAAAVKSEAMPTAEADKRIDAITQQVGSLYVEKEKLTPAEVRERIDAVKGQIKALYLETARLPEKEADERIQQLTAEVRAVSRVERKRKELQKEVDAGAMSAADRDAEIAKLKADLAESRIPEVAKVLAARLKDHQINQTQADDLLKQAKKDDAYLPASPEEEALAQRLLADVEEKAPHNATEKWGILGYLGLNSSLESIDDRIRSPFMPYGLAGVVFGASIVFFAYIGFDAVSTHSEEAKKPGATCPSPS